MTLVTLHCKKCQRQVGSVQVAAGVEVTAVCRACGPAPEAMLHFSMALRAALESSDLKVELVAKRLRVTYRTLMRWQEGRRFRPPYDYRHQLLLVFGGTPGFDIIAREVAAWPV